VGSYTHLVRPYLDVGSLYWPPLLGGVVLSLLHGAGMASDRTEGRMSLGHCGVSVAYLLLSKQVLVVEPNLSPSLPGVRVEERSCGIA
jgi:hypothetical protein